MLVGADGVNSRVRGALEETVPDFTVREVEVMAPHFLGEVPSSAHPLRDVLFFVFSSTYTCMEE